MYWCYVTYPIPYPYMYILYNATVPQYVIVQLTCTMMPQPRHWGVFPCLNHYTLLCSWGVFSYTLGCMRFLEYMGFVLAVFPLKYGFIIVQDTMYLHIRQGK